MEILGCGEAVRVPNRCLSCSNPSNVNLFEERLIDKGGLSVNMDAGIGPVSELLLAEKLVRFVRLPICSGSVPTKFELFRLSVFKLVQLVILSGIVLPLNP